MAPSRSGTDFRSNRGAKLRIILKFQILSKKIHSLSTLLRSSSFDAPGGGRVHIRIGRLYRSPVRTKIPLGRSVWRMQCGAGQDTVVRMTSTIRTSMPASCNCSTTIGDTPSSVMTMSMRSTSHILQNPPPAEFRGVDQRDDLLHRLDHHQRQVTTHEIGRRHTVVEIETVHPEEELAARKLPEHLFGERPYDRKRTVAQHTAELDYRAFVVLRERRSDAQRRRDRRQLLHLADLARHGERRRPRSDENRVARFHEPCGIGSDGAFWSEQSFSLSLT